MFLFTWFAVRLGQSTGKRKIKWIILFHHNIGKDKVLQRMYGVINGSISSV